jgi:hypothetical protein
MPFENEHSCRIAEPSEFKKGSFRRIKEGVKPQQALRHFAIQRINIRKRKPGRIVRKTKVDLKLPKRIKQ